MSLLLLQQRGSYDRSRSFSKKIDKGIGVMKAYTTRVGEGPFVTELLGEFGEKVRQIGGEYGAVTGRPRRCGWLDLVVGRYATMINGLTDIVITKIDVLSGLGKLKICTAYEIDGENMKAFRQIPTCYIEQNRFMKNWTVGMKTLRRYKSMKISLKIVRNI